MKVKFNILVCFLLSCISVWAQPTEKGTKYLNAYKEIAIKEMIRTGVPASITIAQGMLESKYGESDLSSQSNNHFGIKCKNEWTGAKVYHDDDTKGECFRVYNSAEESYRDHSDFLKNRPYYTSLFQLDPLDYEGWARGLKKCGYATETDYPLMLIKIINDYNLNQLSLLAMQRKNQTNVTEEVVVNAQKDTVIKTEAVSAPTAISNTVLPVENEVDTAEENAVKREAAAASMNKIQLAEKKKSDYPDSVFTINHTKVVYATSGTSLLALANKYNISFDRLLDFNEMDETDILNDNNLIFLEKKMKKGASDYHIVQENESLHDICQKEGVRMESVLEYNNLNKKSQPKAGQKLLLRTGINNSGKTANIAVSSNKTT